MAMRPKLKDFCDRLRDRYDSIVVNIVLELEPTDEQIEALDEMIANLS